MCSAVFKGERAFQLDTVTLRLNGNRKEKKNTQMLSVMEHAKQVTYRFNSRAAAVFRFHVRL